MTKYSIEESQVCNSSYAQVCLRVYINLFHKLYSLISYKKYSFCISYVFILFTFSYFFIYMVCLSFYLSFCIFYWVLFILIFCNQMQIPFPIQTHTHTDKQIHAHAHTCTHLWKTTFYIFYVVNFKSAVIQNTILNIIPIDITKNKCKYVQWFKVFKTVTISIDRSVKKSIVMTILHCSLLYWSTPFQIRVQ